MTRILPLTALLTLALTACTDPGTKPPANTDTQAPALSLHLPEQVASHAPLSITVQATDNVGVTRVDFFDGAGQLLGSDTTSPYELVTTAPTNTGGTAITATYTVKAFDAAGNVGSQTARVQVTGESAPPSGDTTRPTVTASAAPNPAASGAQVTLRANAADNVGVTRVEFLDASGQVLGTDTTAPYELVTTAPANTGTAPLTVTYTVQAFDAAGNVGSAQTSVQVAGQTTPPAQGPSVTVSLENAGSILTSGQPVDVLTNVQASGSVTKTELYVDGKLVNWGGGGTGPGRFSGIRAPVNASPAPISATFTVKAYDAAGQVGTGQVSIQVAGLFVPEAGAAVGTGNGTVDGTVRASPTSQEVEVLRLVNEVRTRGTLNGQDAVSGSCVAGTFQAGVLRPLSYSGLLSYTAVQHSTYISQVKYEAHAETETTSPYFYGANVGARLERTQQMFGGPTWGAGENVAVGYQTPLEVMQAWMKSPSHCGNIMSSDAVVLGVGYRENPGSLAAGNRAWTQLFGL